MKQSAKRFVSMFLALFFLVAAFVVFFDLVQPAYVAVQSLRGQLAGETQLLNSEKTLVAQAQNLINSYKSGSSGQQNVSLAIPQGQDVAGALAQVEGIAQNDNVSLTSLGIGAPTLGGAPSPATAGGAGSASQAVKPLGSFTLNLSGSASYENLKNFLDQIETNIRIFDLQSLSLGPASVIAPAATAKNAPAAPVSHDLFNYNLSIRTYYQLP
jgi:hypothetical protein